MGQFFLLFGAVGFFLLTQPVNAQADDSYYISLYNYFSFIPALPITAPQKEQPGDVYLTPGTIFARKPACFNEAKIDSSDTTFPNSLESGYSSMSGEVATEQGTIAQAAAEAGASLRSRVGISYDKVKMDQIVMSDLISLLRSTSASNACRDRSLSFLRSTSDAMDSVPWIIQAVWYATINLSYRTTTAVDARAKAAIDAKLSTLKATGAVNTDLQSDTLVIVNTGKKAFPIAWRPAFISDNHLDYINELRKRGWFQYLLASIGFAKSDQEILEILRKDFKFQEKEVPPPKAIVEGMSRGKLVEFRVLAKDEFAYVQAQIILLGISQAIYGPYRPG